MTPMQALVLSEVERAGADGVPLERLERLLEHYRDLRRLDPPKDPQNIVRVTINQVNRALLAIGKPRICDGRAGDRRYRLEHVYNADDDIRRGVLEGFRAIRERKAAGGPGWGG
jgi:hypothetical protein